MKKKPQPKKPQMKTSIKIALGACASVILGFCIAWAMKYFGSEIESGQIISVWVDSAHHDVRLRSPGIWEEADLPTRYMMRIQGVYSNKFREVEIHPSMYEMYKNKIGQVIQLGDSAKFKNDSIEVSKIRQEWEKEREKELSQ